jgi:hypothetical protein
MLSTIVLFFFLFASNDTALAYRLASKIIGQPPEPGDGAFQFPLGWILLIIAGSIVGWVIGYFVQKYFAAALST